MSQRSDSAQNDHELTELERQLVQFAPQESRVDRETLLFRAGQESKVLNRQPLARASWLWPLTTVVLVIVCAGLSWQLRIRSKPIVLERVRIVERFQARPERTIPDRAEHVAEPREADIKIAHENTPPPIPRDHYLLRRELALTFGMDALNVPVAIRAAGAADESSYRELRSTYTESPSVEREQAPDKKPASDNRYLGDKS